MRRILDPFSLSYIKGQKEIKLTPNEYRILYVLTYYRISPANLACMLELSKSTVKAHVSNLRKKLLGMGERSLLTTKHNEYEFRSSITISSVNFRNKKAPERIFLGPLA